MTSHELLSHLPEAEAAELKKLTARAESLKTQRAKLLTRAGGSCTLQEVADSMGLSRERVRQIERLALMKLHRRINENPDLADLASYIGVTTAAAQ